MCSIPGDKPREVCFLLPDTYSLSLFIIGSSSGQWNIKGSQLGCFWEWFSSVIKRDCTLEKAFLFHSFPLLSAFGNCFWKCSMKVLMPGANLRP